MRYGSDGGTVSDVTKPENAYDATRAPQFKRLIAQWEKYWRGANVWQAGAATAWVYGRPYEVNEVVTAQTFMRSDGPASDSGYGDTAPYNGTADQTNGNLKRNTTTTAYWEESGSGFRFTLANDTDYRMRKAYFATEALPYNKYEGNLVNFTTESVVVGAGMFTQTNLRDLKLFYAAYDAAADAVTPGDVTLSGDDLQTFANATDATDAGVAALVGTADWFADIRMADGLLTAFDADGTVTMQRDADGNVVINKALWGGHYFLNVEAHMRDFAARTTNADDAWFEFWGTGSYRWLDKTMYGTFRTDWITQWWNTNNKNDQYAANSSYGTLVVNNARNNVFTPAWIANARAHAYTYGTASYDYNPYSTQKGNTAAPAKPASLSGNAPYTSTVGACLNVALPPVRPKVEMWGYKNAAAANTEHSLLTDKYATAGSAETARDIPRTPTLTPRRSVDWGTEPRAYWQDEHVGYRAVVTNDSLYAMPHGAQINIGPILPVSDEAAPALLQNAGFRTTQLTLSRALFDAGVEHDVKQDDGTTADVSRIKSVTFSWYAKDAKANSQWNTTTWQGDVHGTGGVKSTVTARTGKLGSELHTTTYDADQVKQWFDDAAGDDVVLTSEKWLDGDLAGVTIEYDYFQKGLTGTDAYVDFFGYTIDSPDVDKRRAITDTWCINDGWEADDGNTVTQFWDWYYTVVQLPSEFRTYDVAEWNYLYAGSDYGAGKKPNGYNSYSPNNYDELTNTRDWGELFAHMPASSQNVTAKAYFVDGATPMGALAAARLHPSLLPLLRRGLALRADQLRQPHGSHGQQQRGQPAGRSQHVGSGL